MARKPARLERAGALTPRDRMWAAIRALAYASESEDALFYRPFSVVEVHYLANRKGGEPIHIDSVESYVRGLQNAQPPYIGFMNDAAGRRPSELHHYRLARDVGVEAPRVTKDGKPVTQGLGNELMWQAMKVLREFDHAELAAAVAAAARAALISVTEETAKTYCSFLCRARYLALVQAAVPGRSKARYRFNRAMNTGPRAPLITKLKEVVDANTGATVQPLGERGCKGQI
jgi:hypothetical protein